MSLNGVSFPSLIKIRPSHLFPVFFVVVLEKRQSKRRKQMRKCYFHSIAI